MVVIYLFPCKVLQEFHLAWNCTFRCIFWQNMPPMEESDMKRVRSCNKHAENKYPASV